MGDSRAERIFDRLESTRLIVEIPQVVVHEADQPNVFGGLLDTDLLAGKHLTEIDLASAWCGRSVLSRVTKSSNRSCCCSTFGAAGLAASRFKVRCMRSCRPASKSEG
jgi:hypothetical protein